MQLLVDSDTAYLVLPKARICIADYFFPANKPSKLKHYTDNGDTHIKYYTLRHVVKSAAEGYSKFVDV